MRPLTLDDLIPLDEYATRRREFLDAQRRYLDRYRRVRVGPQVMLLFENRQTLCFRMQEIIRIARLMEPRLVQDQLDLYNCLLPAKSQLQAALLIDIPENGPVTPDLAAWQTLQGDALQLWLGDRRYPATLVTCRPEDRAVGTAHWVQFDLDSTARRLLADYRQPAYVHLAHRDYQHLSAPLSEDVRQSLLEDLELSDRD